MSIENQLNEIVESIRAKADSADAVHKDELKNLEAAFKSEMAALREEAARKNAPAAIVSDEETLEAEQKAWAHYLAKGDAAIERGADGYTIKASEVSLGVGAEGGYALPRRFASEITEVLRLHSPLRQLATVQRGGSNFVKLLKVENGTAKQRAEKGTITAGSVPTFAELTFGSFEVYDEQATTIWVNDGDAAFDLARIVTTDLVKGIAAEEMEAFMTGTTTNALVKASGSSTIQTGLLNLAVAANATRFTNTIGSIGGVENATTATIVFDDLLNLKASLHSTYQGNASFLFSSDVETALLKLKSTVDGHYIWSMGNVSNGGPATIFGKSYLVDDHMSAVTGAADAAKLVLYGDFSKYVINDHADISFIVDPYTDKRMVKYFARKRVGACLTDFQAMRVLTNKAAS